MPSMSIPSPIHPWVAERTGRFRFAAQLNAGDNPEPGKLLVEAARGIEELGFDAVFLGDHPVWTPDVYLHLAAMAMVTERISLGPIVAAAPYRNPVVSARLVSDLDHLSNGRAVNGLGIGWNAAEWEMGRNEFEMLGIPYPPTKTRQEQLEEYIAVMRGVWHEPPFTFAGTHYQNQDAYVAPPVQQPEPPLLIAGGGKRTLRQAARFADMVNFGPGPAGGTAGPALAAERLAVLKEQCDEIGRPYDHILKSSFEHWLVVAPDQRALDRKIAGYFPGGVEGFWGSGLVAQTVEGAIDYYQRFIDAGIEYFVFQSLDIFDRETLELVKYEVEPVLQSRNAFRCATA
jgi:alkanesulfonate monooxygenase SsuD/methylene tetrahydromethanopterin reductase-like flavin-dependent oxidoreductase (luciferase family)